MKMIYSWLKALAKFINFTRLFIINSIFIIIVLLIIVAINIDEQQVIIKDNSTLHLNFNGVIVEAKQPVDFSSELSKKMLSAENAQVNEYQVDEIIQVIRYAQHDPKIKDILLELDGLTSASLNHLTDIGEALSAFKKSGKKITAIADNYSQSQYLLASFANEVHLNPQGLVFLQGFSVYRLYFKEALDNLLITPHIFKVGTYKSFVEPFTENEMSEESKLANNHWLQQLWKSYSDTVIEQRKSISNITAESLSPTLKQLKAALEVADGNPSVYAQQVGLVDTLTSPFQVLQQMQRDAKSAESHFTLLTYLDYQATLPHLYQSENSLEQIALIHGQGEIVDGEQNSSMIGGDSFSKLLQQALNNNRVKAVVIRLDTPGGSAFASEKIRQQILALKQANKKVVVSMGSVSASGGYWIASAADHIIASPTTLTGSIGIFGMFASIDKALNKFGIYNDGVGTSELSTLNPTRTLNPELADILQLGIEHGYKQFLSVVAEGREMTISEVDKVAQGRVWTGVDALQHGLVDQLGNLQQAINKAAELAKLSEFEIKRIEPAISTKQQLINEMFTSTIKLIPMGIQIPTVAQQAIQTLQTQQTLLMRFNDPQGHYAYCSMCIVK